MELLPNDIIIYHILPKLYTHSINFALVCKNFYNIYLNKINENKFIAERFKRIKNAFDEHIKTQQLVVKFDRIHYWDNQSFPTLKIIVRVFCPLILDKKNINVSIVLTTDEWKTIQCYDFEPCYRSDRYCTGVMYKVDLYNYREMWFAIKVKNKITNYETYDNNNGWNYTTSEKYNSQQRVLNNYGEYSLNNWIHS